MMHTNVRNTLLDILKGILIISVILGHAIQYGSGSVFLQSSAFWEHPLVRLIYSVHMPLFMGLAGYLAYFSLQKHSAVTYILRRWKKLLFPILTWSTLLLCIKICLTRHIPNIFVIGSRMLTTFWFLWSILICSTLVGGCEQIKNAFYKGLLYLGLVIFFMCTPDVLWWNAHKFMFVCFLSGFYVAKYQPTWQLTDHRGIICCILWGMSVWLFHKEAYIYTSGFSIVFTKFPRLYDQILIDMFRYVSAAVGSGAVIYISLHFVKFIQKGENLTHSLTHNIPLLLWETFASYLYFINIPVCVYCTILVPAGLSLIATKWV